MFKGFRDWAFGEKKEPEEEKGFRFTVSGYPSEVGAEHNHRKVGGGPNYVDKRNDGITWHLRSHGVDHVFQAGLWDYPEPGKVIVNSMRNLTSEVLDYYERIAWMTGENVRRGIFSIVVGGGHDIALGSVPGAVRGVREKLKNKNAKLGVLVLDQHLDFNTNITSPSKNIHGMPVAAYTGRGEKKLTNIGGKKNLVDTENVLIVGVDDVDEDEVQAADEAGLPYVTMDEFTETGRDLEPIFKKIDTLCSQVDALYISIDIDASHIDDGPATPMQNPNGLRKEEQLQILAYARKAAEENNIPFVGVEFVEIAPDNDVDGKTKQMVKEMAEVLTVGREKI